MEYMAELIVQGIADSAAAGSAKPAPSGGGPVFR